MERYLFKSNAKQRVTMSGRYVPCPSGCGGAKGHPKPKPRPKVIVSQSIRKKKS